MSNEIIVGLDIGTTKIACFIGQATENGKIKILGFGKTESIGVERGVVKNIDDTAESIKKAVEEASAKAEYEVTEVYVGIAGQHIRSTQSRGSLVLKPGPKITEEKDIEELIQNQYNTLLDPGETIIHVLPQTFFIDGEELTVNPVGVYGNTLEANFLIVTGKTNNLWHIKESVKRANLKIKGVVLEPIASAESVLDDRDKEAGVALVDIGGGTTDIAIFEEGVIRYTSVIPMAGNLITTDVESTCNIMRKQAEQLKIKFGSCLPEMVKQDDIISIPGYRNQAAREISMKMLAQIINARTQMILEMATSEISSAGCTKLRGGIVLTGGGAKLTYIDKLAAFISATDTRIGLPDEHLVDDSPEEIIHPMYATGIGLLLYGIKDKRSQIEKEEVKIKEEVKPEEKEITTSESETQPEQESVTKPSKGKGFVDAVTGFFKDFFTEDEK